LLWSDSLFRLLGHEPTANHEATKAMWTEAMEPDDLEQLLAEWHRAEYERDQFHIEHRMRRVDGRQIWASAAGRFFYDADGKAIRFIGVFFDVTAAKESEQALRDADRRKDEFLATLAHELRNPLAPIRNGLQILQMTRSDSHEQDELIDMMERQVVHMVRLVDDLLEVSRITRGKIELRKQNVELAAIVRSAVETARPTIESAGHELILELPPQSVTLEADSVRLAQILSNLLNNAAKYTEPGGKIWLTATRETDHVSFSVRDTGTGIPTEMLPKVFDLFTQIDHTLGRAQGGLGIGLALVKSLVEMHGGTVVAKSDGLGCGSEFIVCLPVAGGPVPDANSSCEAPAFANGSTAADHLPESAKKQRILVVDDNRDAANTLGMLLKVFGADVETTFDGPSALDSIRRELPDVVFLDIGMPGMDGYTVASQVRQNPLSQRLTLIALTGWGQEEDRRRSREAGFDHHLTKPPDFDEVKKLLASLKA
jgi:PAS domain S-box-containing protein